MRTFLIVLGVIAAFLFICFISFTGIYNGLVGENQEVLSKWAQVENQLQRRNDLIPNFVETVKGYATHEKTLFVDLAKARTSWSGAGSQSGKIKAAGEIGGLLSRLMMVVENYPVLQASTNFRALQDELAGTENRIAVERKRYNDSVQNYNVKAKSFPTIIFVRMFGFDSEKIFFKSDEAAKIAPKVKFN